MQNYMQKTAYALCSITYKFRVGCFLHKMGL